MSSKESENNTDKSNVDNMNNENNEETVRTFTNWDMLDLDIGLLRSIYAHGFEKPSPIQSKAIYPITQGRDIIAQAQSGTGKTGSFTIGTLARINPNDVGCQALVLAPTHELAFQISSVFRNLSEMMDNVHIKTIVGGGSSIDDDIYDMRKNPPQVIVGCPGRVYDMIKRRHINAATIKLMVLDEADEMLSIGFKDQIYNIFQYLNTNVQVALFSATLPNNIMAITEKFMRNPVKICVKSENLTLEGIKQYYVALRDDNEKFDTLKQLYCHINVAQCIIYANSVDRVMHLYEAMKTDGFPVCAIHSNMDRHERERVFKEFRSGVSRVLISTNLTSRGIDIQQVNMVINFDLPRDVHNYLHRIGRSGRWGRKGTGINFVTKRDIRTLREIESHYATQIDELPMNFAV